MPRDGQPASFDRRRWTVLRDAVEGPDCGTACGDHLVKVGDAIKREPANHAGRRQTRRIRRSHRDESRSRQRVPTTKKIWGLTQGAIAMRRELLWHRRATGRGLSSAPTGIRRAVSVVARSQRVRKCSPAVRSGRRWLPAVWRGDSRRLDDCPASSHTARSWVAVHRVSGIHWIVSLWRLGLGCRGQRGGRIVRRDPTGAQNLTTATPRRTRRRLTTSSSRQRRSASDSTFQSPATTATTAEYRSGPGSGEARCHGGTTRRYGWDAMMNRQRRHLLPAVALAAAAALMATGCSGGDTGSDADTTGAAVSAATLDGVRIDVRRDPG